jgi:Bax protein
LGLVSKVTWLNNIPAKVFVLLGVMVWVGAYSLLAEPGAIESTSQTSIVGPANRVLPRSFHTLPDFSQYPAGEARKSAFFNYLLPVVGYINTEIATERNQLRQWREAFASQKSLSAQQMDKIAALAEKYQVDEDSLEGQLAVLWRRVDTVPPSLALAQAANESAYGTSRFAVEANNLFGQWCFRQGCGLVPSARQEDASHEVRKFASPVASVRSYMYNLNTNRAYASLRQLRSNLRRNNQAPSGPKLVETLLHYSSRGQDYVEELATMIRYNKLSEFDHQTKLLSGSQSASQP